MKKLIFACIICVPMSLFAQNSDKAYTMVQLVTLQPNGEDYAGLEKAMKSHNEKYHKSGPYKAAVFTIDHGPNAGKLVWHMGPVTYSELDKRPASEEHNQDWDKVMKHIESVSYNEMWKMNDEWSLLKEKSANMNLVRFWNSSRENGFMIGDLMKKVSAVHKAMNREYSWSVWDNQFRQGNRGRHLAAVSGFGSWAEMDQDYKFKEKFMEIHGENSWEPFVRSMEIAFEDSWDEIWVYSPKMSAD